MDGYEKMDGYDVTPTRSVFHNNVLMTREYRVYTLSTINNRIIKHYHNGYSNYKQMLSKHPELKR